MGVMEMAPRDRMADRNVDLAALNDAERGALELLAEGHTVKSIADLTGRSVAAINERLREARRKTGVGSSRELARLLKAQKNRDEKIDLSAARATAAVLEPEDGQRSRGPSRKGWIVMA
jgi:DNA-binding CsgD family transcriptional regulator